MKIFKYNYNLSTREVEMPENAIVLRADHVDDGFYFGDFIWAIVDPAKPKVKQIVNFPLGYSFAGEPPGLAFDKIQLDVCEKQSIVAYGEPIFAKETGGRIYAYCGIGGEEKEYKIAVYKTGQTIDLPIESLTYFGLNRLWIIQELALYCFWYV